MKNFIFLALFLTSGLCVQAGPLESFSVNKPCLELIKDFIRPNKARLEIKDGSLFHYDPDLIQKIDKLNHPGIQVSTFYKKFEESKKRAPTLREAMSFIIESRNKILSNYEMLITELQKRNQNEHMNLPILIRELKKSKEKLSHFKSIDQVDHELRLAYLNNKTNIASLDVVIELKNREEMFVMQEHFKFFKSKLAIGNFQGEYGELIAISSANEKIIVRGLSFKSESAGIKSYIKNIAALVQDLEVRLNGKTEAELVEIVRKNNHGLLKHVGEYLSEKPKKMFNKEMIIEKIMEMVRSKEIDFVLIDSKGRYVWNEVKTYTKTITKENIIVGNYLGKKTIYDQLVEHKELAELLNLKDVRFRFISPLSSVDAEAQKIISELGYEVIYAM